MARAKKITAYVHRTHPGGRPGQTVEVDANDSKVKRYLETGVLEQVESKEVVPEETPPVEPPQE